MATPSPAPTSASGMTHRQILLVFSGLMAGMFLAALDQTIVATALPTIVGELGGLEHLSWLVTAYLLTSTASSPLYGKISDLYGRKRVFQAAIVIFLLGSGLAGLSQSVAQLIAFRALQGLGAGGVMVLAMTIVGDILSPRERGRYQGYIGGVFAVSSIAGPLLGGFIVDNLNWRWVFYLNIPIGLVALAITGVALNIPFRRVDHPVDYAGAGLLVAAVTSILLMTVWGGSEYAWSSPTIIGLGVAGTILTVLFVLQERRATEPILPLRLFANHTFTLTSGVGFIIGLAMFGSIVFLPLFLQTVTGVTATSSGLLLLPQMVGMLSTSITSGRLISRTGRYKRYPLIGTLVMALGLFLLSTMNADTPFVQTAAYMILLGAGMGLVMQVLVIAVQNAVAHEDLGVATSSATFFRSLGGSFGTALFGAIMTSRLATNLAGLLPAGTPVDTARLTGSPATIAALPAAVKGPVIEALTRSITSVFGVAVPFAVAAFIAVLFLREIPLRETTRFSEAPEGVAS